MAGVLNGIFGGSQPSKAPVAAGDSDFADFAGAPDPVPAGSVSGVAGSSAASPTGPAVPWTKWYNIHERHSIGEFKQEGFVLVLVLAIVLIHVVGTRINRKKAKTWIAATAPVLQKEFTLVGFGDEGPSLAAVESDGLSKATADSQAKASTNFLKEKSPMEFLTYASGRQNVAFVDLNLTLYKRYRPFSVLGEFFLGLFFDSMPAPSERMLAVLYPFDGKESLTVPGLLPGAQEIRKDKSAYDGFVWAVVNKDNMKQLRDERYDLSITSTKDSPKLPLWATVMSESAEVTELLLTPELIAALENVGDAFEYLIVTDQPIDQPEKLEETVPKKRMYLSIKLASEQSSKIEPLFQYFIRLTDQLVQSAHFRPEVMRKMRSTREDMTKRLKKAEEEEKSEERALELEKAKKQKRDAELGALDAKAQKKYLEKEKEKEQRRQAKKQSARG